MNSSTRDEQDTDGGQRPNPRWPPFSGLAWNICILFSANDACMRDLALTASETRAERRARSDADGLAGGHRNSAALDLEALASGKEPR